MEWYNDLGWSKEVPSTVNIQYHKLKEYCRPMLWLSVCCYLGYNSDIQQLNCVCLPLRHADGITNPVVHRVQFLVAPRRAIIMDKTNELEIIFNSLDSTFCILQAAGGSLKTRFHSNRNHRKVHQLSKVIVSNKSVGRKGIFWKAKC